MGIGLDELGYDEKLYVLAFDHRGSFEKMVGDVDRVPGAKTLIWEGFQRAVELGFNVLACASTGNLGNAVAARAAALGMRSVVLYPDTVEPEKLLATAVYGSELYAVRGSYDDCSRLVVELAGELDWAFVNVNLRAYYAEGSKTVAFEIAEQLGWEFPDAVVSPVASGSPKRAMAHSFGMASASSDMVTSYCRDAFVHTDSRCARTCSRR